MLVCEAADVPAHVRRDVLNDSAVEVMFQAMFKLKFLLPNLIKMKMKINEALLLLCHFISKKGEYMKEKYTYQTPKTIFIFIFLFLCFVD